MAENRKLRLGLAGGGPGAFIGPVHRIAAELDGRIELVAGAFSSSPEKSRAAGESFRIDPARAYASYQEMLQSEKKREDGIDFVVIATPNSLHLPVAKAALEAGIPVVSDKPATATYEEVLELEKVEKQAGWRVDPALNGPGGCIGDIGTHAFHLIEYTTGLQVTAIHGTLRSVVEGRRVDDDC